ncbi:MAG TPA: class I SAM-dependent methyltransferase [Chryseolinea sp.]|nr:class I SAM-dependent methyltransferase [Chryseolinea sp.]
MKDYFSSQSKLYATFRPTYPKELYEFIFQYVREKKVAWDCATGNGQVANYLSAHFDEVYATDISQQQLDQARKQSNIFYSLCPAEKTSFQENQFNLITVAQALHWFDQDAFYNEARRVGKPGALLAAWGYALLYIEPIIDEIIMDYYNHTVGPYWDNARKLVEEQYRTISFPFEEIQPPPFSIKVQWTITQLSGYLSSWSATQKYIKEKGHDPVSPFIKRLKKYWTKSDMTVTFPLFTRIGVLTK